MTWLATLSTTSPSLTWLRDLPANIDIVIVGITGEHCTFRSRPPSHDDRGIYNISTEMTLMI
jgi:hypothetical protein